MRSVGNIAVKTDEFSKYFKNVERPLDKVGDYTRQEVELWRMKIHHELNKLSRKIVELSNETDFCFEDAFETDAKAYWEIMHILHFPDDICRAYWNAMWHPFGGEWLDACHKKCKNDKKYFFKRSPNLLSMLISLSGERPEWAGKDNWQLGEIPASSFGRYGWVEFASRVDEGSDENEHYEISQFLEENQRMLAEKEQDENDD